MSGAEDTHTQGPWSVGDEDKGFTGFAYIDVHAGEYGNGYRSIAHVQGENDESCEAAEINAEVRANACLIAAAPEAISLRRCYISHTHLRAERGRL